MSMWTFIKAEPSGFVVVMGDGSINLRSEEKLMSAGINGEEWDVAHTINLKVGEQSLVGDSKWAVRRPNADQIVFEMIDDSSKTSWGVPLLMTVNRQDLIDSARMLLLI